MRKHFSRRGLRKTFVPRAVGIMPLMQLGGYARPVPRASQLTNSAGRGPHGASHLIRARVTAHRPTGRGNTPTERSTAMPTAATTVKGANGKGAAAAATK